MKTLVTFVILFLSAQFANAQWTLPKSFCLEMPGHAADGNGMIYGQLDWTDASHTAVKFTVTEGYAKNKVFQGPYNSTTKTANLEISNDSLFGTRSIAAGTNFTLDMTHTTLATINIYEHTSSTSPFFIGTSGRCTIDFNEHYCALMDDGHFTIQFGAESGGYVSGTISEYPTGFTETFNAVVSPGGLNLSWTSVIYPTVDFNLDFTLRGISGLVNFSGTPFNVAGMRDPIGGGGCSNINMYRYRYSDANMYYNIPTVSGDSIYVGTSEGSNWRKTSNNYFARINAKTMREQWIWDLSGEEVRGGSVVDPTGNYVYFVTEEGRTQDTTGWEPTGDHTASKLYLYKLSNPTSGTPTLEWKKEIAASRTTPDTYTIKSSGQYTPVVRSNGDVFVGGENLNGYDSTGAILAGFPYTTPYCPTGSGSEVRGAPLLYRDSSSTDYLIFVSQCGMHSLEIDHATENWYIAPGTNQYLSSPQFGKNSSGVNDSVYVALGTGLYCVDPSNGHTCSSWPGSPWPTTCTISGISGEIRSSPVIDSSGNVYFGTKNNNSSKIYKMDPTSCSTGTPDWSYSINNDVYSTGVLTDAGEFVVTNETSNTSDGNINFYDTTTGAISQSLYLHGDHSWGGTLKIYTNSTDSTHHLIGTSNDGGNFQSGMIWSITIPDDYDSTAKSSSFRGLSGDGL